MLFLTLLVAHFLHAWNFGLYEDDYYYIGEPLAWEASDAARDLVGNLTEWPQGRPLGFAIPRLVAYLVGSTLGIPAIYAVGFAILFLNAALLFDIARKLMPTPAALAASLFYAMFPADTTRPLLTHALQLQTAAMFGLLAVRFLIARRPKAAFVFFGMTLLTYETFALPFLVASLLLDPPWKPNWRGLLRHVALALAIALAIGSVRYLQHESRVHEAFHAGWTSLIGKVAAAPFVGVFVSARAALVRPLEAALTMRPLEWAIVLGYSAALLALVRLSALAFAGVPRGASRAAPDETVDHHVPPRSGLSAASWMLFCGLLTWLSGYLLSFTHWPPVALLGRGTSVHAAAAIGASLFVGALVSTVCSQGPPLAAWRWASPLLAAYASLLAGFHLTIQRDFADSWRLQQAFWRQVVEFCPDLEDGTVVFVLSERPPRPRAILVNSWADPIVLSKMFRYPSHWSAPPRLFVLQNETLASFRRIGNDIVWTVPAATWEAHTETLLLDRVVVLKSENCSLLRLSGPVRLGTVEVEAKSLSTLPAASLPRGRLYDHLLQSDAADR